MKQLSILLILLSIILINGLKKSMNNVLNVRQKSMILNSKLEALLFDCDGVIVETEELHRLFNSLFV